MRCRQGELSRTFSRCQWLCCQVGPALTGRQLEAVRSHAEVYRDRCRLVSANWLLDCDQQRCLVHPAARQHLMTQHDITSLTSLRQVGHVHLSHHH